MGRHRSLREWAAYPEFQETPLPEVGGIGAWQGMRASSYVHTVDIGQPREVGWMATKILTAMS